MYKDVYKKWLEKATEYKQELESISGNEAEIEDRFYQNLEFGTAGLRGKMYAGTNCMNIYTVRKATEGLAEVITAQGSSAMQRGVTICYDSRNNSKDFAHECAKVLAAHNINVHIYDDIRPTPQCSFTIRHLSTIAGIMITASHNPKEYNGYKCYWEDGAQMPTPVSDKLSAIIEKVDEFNINMPTEDQEKKFIHTIDKDVDGAYLTAVLSQSIRKGGDLKITYTPLYGTGNIPVRECLSRDGFNDITLVEEQVQPNGNFPTAPFPNPEKFECWEQAIKTAEKAGSDIAIATDPDGDRIGVMARDKSGNLQHFTGNEVGIMLTEYVLSNKKLPQNPAIISTIVSSRLTKKIAKEHNVAYFDVYTGFKNIAEKILEFEHDGNFHFVMGFEESIGYLIGTHARDKDAVVASIIICEMAQHCKDNGKTLWDFLAEVHEKYGTRYELTVDVVREGAEGAAEIKAMMAEFRQNPPESIGGVRVIGITDYSLSSNPSNVLSFELASGSEICVRPSGTEPKIKFYFSAVSPEELEKLKEFVDANASVPSK